MYVRCKGDTHGNSVASLNAKGKPKVMLAGHIDKIGFQVNHISKEGYIYFKPIGGSDIQIIPGRRVLIHTKDGPLKGVIGKKAIHLMTSEERKKILTMLSEGKIDVDQAERLLNAVGESTLDDTSNNAQKNRATLFLILLTFSRSGRILLNKL